ncbi:hypothetical protein SBRY_20678 [Actinacidiphila bryophytorum]|uniref:Uncharacterized protein n=1 Tax=Actinacidiphila bryophytorum TaxID=1436133 RepID=A0A9W4EDU8_9ACTN|nr:hypothetical protein SBRY_20678 [Actinacidiphila bryophytorum]
MSGHSGGEHFPPGWVFIPGKREDVLHQPRTVDTAGRGRGKELDGRQEQVVRVGAPPDGGHFGCRPGSRAGPAPRPPGQGCRHRRLPGRARRAPRELRLLLRADRLSDPRRPPRLARLADPGEHRRRQDRPLAAHRPAGQLRHRHRHRPRRPRCPRGGRPAGHRTADRLRFPQSFAWGCPHARPGRRPRRPAAVLHRDPRQSRRRGRVVALRAGQPPGDRGGAPRHPLALPRQLRPAAAVPAALGAHRRVAAAARPRPAAARPAAGARHPLRRVRPVRLRARARDGHLAALTGAAVGPGSTRPWR